MNQQESVENKIIVKPYSPNLGGVVTGIDLSKEISNSELNFIKDAFNHYQVLFFSKSIRNTSKASGEIRKVFWPSTSSASRRSPPMQGHPEIFEIHTHKNSKISNGTEEFSLRVFLVMSIHL